MLGTAAGLRIDPALDPAMPQGSVLLAQDGGLHSTSDVA